MALDKLVDSSQLDSALTSVANAIRTKGGTSSSLAFPQGFVDAIDAIETGGGSGWQRPADWPDYSKLHLAENETEAEFFTYDNREAASGIQGLVGIYVDTTVATAGDVLIDRVSIGADGAVTVLETNAFTRNSDCRLSIPLDAGNWVCYRVTSNAGHITSISMAGTAQGSFEKQRCVERYGYLPYCTVYGSTTSAARKWGGGDLVSDTILTMPSGVTKLNYERAYKLVNLPTGGWKTVTLSGVQFNSNFYFDAGLTNIDMSLFDLTGITAATYAFSYSGIEELDMSMLSIPSVTNLANFANACLNLRWFRSPSGMGAITNTADMFNNCINLETAEFDASFTGTVSVRSFANCTNLKALILRAESVCPLSGVANVNAFMAGGGGYLFVPASVLEDYKAATNWSSLSAYILPIEGSYWETHHADGSLMEVAA